MKLTIINKIVIFHKDVCSSRNLHLKLLLAPFQNQKINSIHSIRLIRAKGKQGEFFYNLIWVNFKPHAQPAIFKYVLAGKTGGRLKQTSCKSFSYFYSMKNHRNISN